MATEVVTSRGKKEAEYDFSNPEDALRTDSFWSRFSRNVIVYNRCIREKAQALIWALIRALHSILKQFYKATIAGPITRSGNSQL